MDCEAFRRFAAQAMRKALDEGNKFEYMALCKLTLLWIQTAKAERKKLLQGEDSACKGAMSWTTQ